LAAKRIKLSKNLFIPKKLHKDILVSQSIQKDNKFLMRLSHFFYQMHSERSSFFRDFMEIDAIEMMQKNLKC